MTDIFEKMFKCGVCGELKEQEPYCCITVCIECIAMQNKERGLT